jgi:putative peptidoglycan lipid II flippase
MLVSLWSIAVNFFVSWYVTRHTSVGHPGLALSTSVVALFNFLVLFVILRNRIGGVYGRSLLATFTKVCAAASVMGACVWLSSRMIQASLGIHLAARLVDLTVSIGLGLAVFYCLCRLLHVEELALAVRSITRKKC